MSETRLKRRIEFIESYWTGGELGSDYQWNDNHGELIRCKDCKCLNAPANGVLFCKRIKKFVDADWFCADGKRE